MSIALLKRNALAAPFEAALDAQSSGQTLPFMKIDYREEETIFIGAKPDRVTVIFQTTFKDDVDKVFGKVFLQVGCSNLICLTTRLDDGNLRRNCY